MIKCQSLSFGDHPVDRTQEDIPGSVKRDIDGAVSFGEH